MVGVVGSHRQLTQSAILRNPRTKYKRSKNVFSVTSIALSCAHICARLLQPLAQSLIGSPGTLVSRQTTCAVIRAPVCSQVHREEDFKKDHLCHYSCSGDLQITASGLRVVQGGEDS